MIFDKLRDIIV